MANRNFQSVRHSLEKRVVDIFAHITIGGTGAPTLDTTASKGVASISRTSAGLYVLTLEDRYVRLLMFQSLVKLVSTSIPASPFLQLSAETVATNKTITFQYADVSTPSATDPASGEELYLQITLCDSTAF